MFDRFPLFPEAAATGAHRVDELTLFLVAVCGAMALLVFVLVIFFAIKYRRRPGNEIPVEFHPPKWMEISLIASWFVVFMAMFVWGAKVYFVDYRPPDNAMDVYVTGRQWMWKFQHEDGKRELNALHVPLGRPVKLIMTSEDVIHSLYFPAFRIKQDVIPNRYTYEWFVADKPGTYHIFCAEYCGTEHSLMVGTVYVMEPMEFQIWNAGGTPEGSPAAEGKKLFDHFACNTCHTGDATGRGPNLNGVFGKPVQLANGQVVTADENYVRESILEPAAKVVNGFQPIMPTFKGQVNESQILQLVAYVKSLGAPQGNTLEAAPNVESPASKGKSSGSGPRTPEGPAAKTQ